MQPKALLIAAMTTLVEVAMICGICLVLASHELATFAIAMLALGTVNYLAEKD